MLKNYDHLLQIEPRSQAQNLALAELCLKLVEAEKFPATKTTQVRALLNKAAKQSLELLTPNLNTARAALMQRVLAIEASSKSDAPQATRVSLSS